jgi:iron complex outermembrane receptor protein
MAVNNNFPTRIARWGSKLVWYTLIGATGLLLTAPVMARGESAWFDIAAQPLPAALRAFATQAQVQLLYEYDAVASTSGNAVTGELDKQAALAQLLRNTGFEVIYSSGNAATIRPTTSDKQAEQKAEADAHRLRLAQAQGGQPRRHDSASDAGTNLLEEVIVTARRREEKIQSVPIAITVVSQEKLQDNNAQTIGDLQYLVPSMSARTGLTRDAVTVSIRGQGSNSSSALPGVVAYLNEVPIPTNNGGELAGGPGLFFDLENVQVLKGPQGTLFGRNSVGGALLLQTKRPTNEFGGRVQLTYGNYNDREVEGAINLPIVDDKLLARVAFSGQQRDGFTRLLGDPGHPNGIDADNRDTWSARGTVTFRPTDWFQNDAILTYSTFDGHGSPSLLTYLNVSPTGCAGGPCPVPSLFPTLRNLLTQQQGLGIRTALPIDTGVASSGHTLSLNNISRISLTDTLTFRNIFGYVEANTVYAVDFDGTALPVADIPSTPRHWTFKQITEEAQLLGESLDGRLDWIVGAFLLDEMPPDGDVVQTGKVFGLPFDLVKRQQDNSKALFAQGTYDLSSMVSDLKFTAGARYTWDDRYYGERGGKLGSVCVAPTVNCNNFTSQESKTEATTWTVGFDYQAAPDTLLYLASRRGYRAGGYNIFPNPGFRPEYVNDLELGVKSDWKAGSIPIRTNAAIYYQKYRDIQVQKITAINNVPTVVTANAAAARLWGAEIEALVQLTRDLQFTASFNYLSLDYTEFDPGVDGAALTATRTANRPPRKYGASARYRLPLGAQAGDIGEISVQANWNWQASNGDTSQPGGVIDSFGLLNAAIDWSSIGGKPLDASLFASNVTDKVYSIGGATFYNSLGYANQRFGEPRMYGIRMRYRFGAE